MVADDQLDEDPFGADGLDEKQRATNMSTYVFALRTWNEAG